MKIKKRVIVIAVLLGLIATWLAYYYIQNIEQQQPPEEVVVQLTDVVVAEISIPAHVQITAEMLSIQSLPVEAVHPDAARSIDELVGFVTKQELYAGEQVLKSRMALDLQQTALSFRIPENMRAITVPVSETTGVAGHITVGDRIDMLFTYNEPEISESTITFTQFQNIEVVAKGASTGSGNTADDIGLTGTITILVTPEQAEVLVYANYTAGMYLTLRNPADDNSVSQEGFNLENFDTWRVR